MLKRYQSHLLIALISVLSLTGCPSATFSKKFPSYPKLESFRDCRVGQTSDSKIVIRCMYKNSKGNLITEDYDFSAKMASAFAMSPIIDLPVVDRYKAEVETWTINHCSERIK